MRIEYTMSDREVRQACINWLRDYGQIDRFPGSEDEGAEQIRFTSTQEGINAILVVTVNS